MKSCPRHSVELRSRTGGESKIEECPDCSGIWVAGASIDGLLGSGQMLQLRSLCSVLESDLTCPLGCGSLHEGKVGPVTIDLCQECGGLWLDPGELESLRQRRSVTPYQPPEKDPVLHPAPSSGEEWILPALILLLN